MYVLISVSANAHSPPSLQLLNDALDASSSVLVVAEMMPPPLFFPFASPRVQIVKDKIWDVSVKLQFSQEDAWTRALRHVLLVLKILLKWADKWAQRVGEI
ncbi:hypothetical protein FIBSPDRAFT_945129 [Athelia psychrophila]|uniref:Uncharacterized protein n=1 Tax=Athelia psychrophila TaxID=1759441 RepID=A0A166UEK3_9AGAM|nr:hypothetical protein FIBSPDRAFT_945129 [Fibularhizoctonia sp. CBS 109695]